MREVGTQGGWHRLEQHGSPHGRVDRGARTIYRLAGALRCALATARALQSFTPVRVGPRVHRRGLDVQARGNGVHTGSLVTPLTAQATWATGLITVAMCLLLFSGFAKASWVNLREPPAGSITVVICGGAMFGTRRARIRTIPLSQPLPARVNMVVDARMWTVDVCQSVFHLTASPQGCNRVEGQKRNASRDGGGGADVATGRTRSSTSHNTGAGSSRFKPGDVQDEGLMLNPSTTRTRSVCGATRVRWS
jgi:hypothetical protein